LELQPGLLEFRHFFAIPHKNRNFILITCKTLKTPKLTNNIKT